MAAEEEEVAVELEAVKAVYGDDCVVLDSFPPHLHVHIKPRTADITSQQFVEAVISIRASSEYPKEPPYIDVIDSKGIDEQRKKYLISCIRDKALELSSCFMLVALCEEAVDRLSSMNHPDGDCPLCLYPLVLGEEQNNVFPFMKLMSCFHCFHCECIIRWWNWLQTEKDAKAKDSSSLTFGHYGPTENSHKEDGLGNCPVCRKVFHSEDFEHVLDLVGNHSSQWSHNKSEFANAEKFLLSDSEEKRRQRFEAILNLQKENSGLIDPKISIAIVPGMFLPQPTPSSISDRETRDQVQPQRRDVKPEAHSSSSSNGSRNPSIRRGKARNSRQQGKQWVRKDNETAR